MELPTNLRKHLDDYEREIIENALRLFRWNRTAAAKAMGMTLRQMRYRLAKLGITKAGMKNSVIGNGRPSYNVDQFRRPNPEWRD